MPTCLVNDPSSNFSYCPSFVAAVLFAVLFGTITFTHVIQAFLHRHAAAWVLIMAGLWETGGYISRSISIYHQTSSGVYIAQFLLILLAPLWINAYVYMILGRMMHFFLANDRVFGIRARRTTLIFVLFDIMAFLVQLTGGIMTSGTDQPVSTIQLGLNVYTGGVALQLAFISTFIFLSARFRQLLTRQDLGKYGHIELMAGGSTDSLNTEYRGVEHRLGHPPTRDYAHARPLLGTLWIALSLIIARNIFRLIEYAMGGVNGNTITRHEWFQYVFDATLMFSAMVMMSVFHPAKVLQGDRSDFSEEDKSRKTQRKARKHEKRVAKSGRKEAKSRIYGVV